MKLQLVIFFCLLAIGNTRSVKRIIAGRNAVKANFPNVVAIFGTHEPYPDKRDTAFMFCGGTLYTLKWIVITSLCARQIGFKVPKKDILVSAGNFDVTELERYTQFRSIDVIHTYADDHLNRLGRVINLAMISVEDPFRASIHVAPSTFSKEETYASGNVQIAGYGAVSIQEPEQVGPLNVIELELTSRDLCREGVSSMLEQDKIFLPIDLVVEYHICTGTRTQNIRGPTLGDHGTAVMQFNTTTRKYDVIGISSSKSKEWDFQMHIFTPRLVSWIDSVIQRFDPPPNPEVLVH